MRVAAVAFYVMPALCRIVRERLLRDNHSSHGAESGPDGANYPSVLAGPWIVADSRAGSRVDINRTKYWTLL
jgi:hypothetical protein